jgi:Glyoxalase-like domain
VTGAVVGGRREDADMTLQLTIDCADPAPLVQFWGPALGYVPAPPPHGHSSWNDYYRSLGVSEDELPDGVDACDRLIDPAGNGPRIWFQIVPERKSVKNRLHLDLLVDGARDLAPPERRSVIEGRVAELVAAGATVLHRSEGDGIDHYGVTLADPEGNEFCVA